MGSPFLLKQEKMHAQVAYSCMHALVNYMVVPSVCTSRLLGSPAVHAGHENCRDCKPRVSLSLYECITHFQLDATHTPLTKSLICKHYEMNHLVQG